MTIETALSHLPDLTGQTVVVATSGGVDSMSLLHALAHLRSRDFTVVVAHFDHQLRPQSQAEQQAVQRVATGYGFAFVGDCWQAGPTITTNVEAAARTARYRFLVAAAKQVNAQVVMTAHHGDDQVETLLMQWLRSGQALKMQGMQAARPLEGLTLLRPLLSVEKVELYAYAKQHQLWYAEDATNCQDDASRNWLRHHVVPRLKQQSPQLVAHTNRLAQEVQGLAALAMAQAKFLLDQARLDAWRIDWRQLGNQPAAVQQVLLNQALAEAGAQLNQRQNQALLFHLNLGQGSQAFSAYPHPVWSCYGQLWLRMPKQLSLTTPVLLSTDGQWQSVGPLRVGRFDHVPDGISDWASVSASATVVLRHPQPGDWLLIAGGHRQLLRRWFINTKVPQPLRANWLVAASGSQILWLSQNPRPELFHRPRTDTMCAVLAFDSDD